MKNEIAEIVTSRLFDFPKIAEAISKETESPIEIGINGVHMNLDAQGDGKPVEGSSGDMMYRIMVIKKKASPNIRSGFFFNDIRLDIRVVGMGSDNFPPLIAKCDYRKEGYHRKYRQEDPRIWIFRSRRMWPVIIFIDY